MGIILTHDIGLSPGLYKTCEIMHKLYIFIIIMTIHKMPLDPINTFLANQKCPSCGSPLRLGITTKFDEKTNSEICKICKAVLGKK